MGTYLSTNEYKRISSEVSVMKLPIPVEDCPECGKKYIPTPKSPDKCLLCERLEK